MSEYGTVQSGFWVHPKITQLEDSAKLLAVYLLTCKHKNALGCFYLPYGYIMSDLNWDERKVIDTLSILYRKGFVKVCSESGYVILPDFLEWNTIKNQKHCQHILNKLDEIPKHFSYFAEIIESLEKYGRHFPMGIDTVSIRSRYVLYIKVLEYNSTPPTSPPLKVEPEKKKRRSPGKTLNNGQAGRFRQFYYGNEEGILNIGDGYPRKEDPGSAERAWKKFDDGSQEFITQVLPKILSGVGAYKRLIESDKRPRDKIKLPATWLNARAWESEYSEPATLFVDTEKEINPYDGIE